jgi:hypothetical protein
MLDKTEVEPEVMPLEAERLERDYQIFLKEANLPPDLIGRQAVVYWQGYGGVKCRTQVRIIATHWHEEGMLFLYFASPEKIGIQDAVCGMTIDKWTIHLYADQATRREMARRDREEQDSHQLVLAYGGVVVLEGSELPKVSLEQTEEVSAEPPDDEEGAEELT